tara:strand:- start:466 stop:996 length:531 start_codon:yes stop_codon:yes gene_type:complete
MILGKHKLFILILVFFFINSTILFAADKIKSVPLINLEDLPPTFEEDKDELEKNDVNISNLKKDKTTLERKRSKKSEKVFINIKALDKITAKTFDIKLVIGEKKIFGPLEIKVLKCQPSKDHYITETVAYLQVKDNSVKDNNQVFLFNGWTFSSSPTLKSIEHPVYDLWIISCENI